MLKQVQTINQVLSPQMIQALNILQMNSHQLREYINQQLLENPALDIDNDYDSNSYCTDMENIQMELEKLLCYCMDRDVITDEDVEAVCVNRISNHIFDMVNAIASGNTKEALSLYYDLLALKEPAMRILFLIARQYNLLLQTKELKQKGFSDKDIASKIGVPPFVAGKYVAQASRFKTSDLKTFVKRCVETEEAVKTGQMNDVISVEILIVSA